MSRKRPEYNIQGAFLNHTDEVPDLANGQSDDLQFFNALSSRAPALPSNAVNPITSPDGYAILRPDPNAAPAPQQAVVVPGYADFRVRPDWQGNGPARAMPAAAARNNAEPPEAPRKSCCNVM